MILLISGAFEPNIKNVIEIFDAQGIGWIRINGADLVKKHGFDISIGNDVPATTTLRQQLQSEQLIDLNLVSAVWNRRLGPLLADPALDSSTQSFIQTEVKAVIDALEFLTPQARWMNPLWADLIAENPLKQLLAAKQAGLKVPDTLVTQSIETAKHFVNRHQRKVVIKMLSNVNPASLGIRKFFLTNRWSETADQYLEHIQYCPTLLQAEVEKLTEIRVTVVGEQVFAAAIAPVAVQSAGVDIREGDLTVFPHAEYVLPLLVKQQILRMLDILSLHFCTLDLVKTPAGEYVFLDLNPCGQYGWTETMTTMQINRAIAGWLSGAAI